tara:strand:- start:225 stop:791 length:567 start_codon:yes stop_codon:yes gene_type:complete
MKIINKTIFSENQVFNFYFSHLIDDDGREVKKYFILEPKNIKKDRTAGVAILPVINEEIGLINIFRPAIDSYSWEIPHGFIDKHESDREAAARELREETSLKTGNNNLTSLGYVFPDTGIMSARVHLFSVEVGHITNEKLSELGIQKFSFFNLKEIKKMIEHSEISDSYTLVSILKFLNLKKKINWNL